MINRQKINEKMHEIDIILQEQGERGAEELITSMNEISNSYLYYNTETKELEVYNNEIHSYNYILLYKIRNSTPLDEISECYLCNECSGEHLHRCAVDGLYTYFYCKELLHDHQQRIEEQIAEIIATEEDTQPVH